MYKQVDGGWWGGKADQLGMTVYLGGGKDGGFSELDPELDLLKILTVDPSVGSDSWSLPPSTTSQAIVFDVDGSLRPSLLAIPADDEIGGLKVWRNNGSGMSV